jgi:hypothetical protein
MECAVCHCEVTEPYGNPLGPRQITCWYCADYFYIWHPEHYAAAQLKHKDVPNVPHA